MSSSAKSRKKPSKKNPLPFLFIKIGLALIILAVTFFIVTFFPAFKAEIGYLFSLKKNLPVVVSTEKPIKSDFLRPVNEEFGIVIPRIRANAAVIADVSPFNEKEYQIALTKGVAHARDTALPDQKGNIFIFAHSAGDFYNANRYNAIFYLLNKMKKNDPIYLIYKGIKFKYIVKEVKTVAPNDLQYLQRTGYEKSLTLMTCWPPGTTLKRLLVIAEQSP